MRPETLDEIGQQISELANEIEYKKLRKEALMRRRERLLSESLDTKINQCWEDAMQEGSLWASPKEVFNIAVDKMKEKGIISE